VLGLGILDLVVLMPSLQGMKIIAAGARRAM
jgi:hypothetical protein